MGQALGLRAAEAFGAPHHAQPGVGSESDRSVRPRAARSGRPRAVARSRQGNHPPACHLRSDRTAANARGSRRVPGGSFSRCVREACGRSVAVPALRRTHGHAVARRLAIRRYARLSHRQPPRDVALAGLGHQRLQHQSAVRSIRDRSGCGRPAAERDPRSEDRVRIQPQPHDQFRRRCHRRRVSGRIRRRSGGGDVEHLHGTHDGVRTVPYPQVRSHHAEGVLPVLRVLQHRPGTGTRRPHRQRGASDAAAVARPAGAARRARCRHCDQAGGTRRLDRCAAAILVGADVRRRRDAGRRGRRRGQSHV